MNKFRKYFKKISRQKAANIKVVVLCVLAATTFWVLNALNKDNYSTVVNQPIEFYYDRNEFIAVEELPSSVRIEIYGNGWDLLRKYFRVNVVPFPIEMTNPSTQDYILTSTFQRALAEQTAPTQLSAILEDTLHINIDSIVTRSLKVDLDTSRKILAGNFRFASDIRFHPDSVSVTGASSIIEQKQGTIPVVWDEEELSHDYSQMLPLHVPKEHEDLIYLETEEVLVEFEVVEFLAGNRRLDIRTINFPSSVSVNLGDSTVVMDYLVDEREVEALKELEFDAILNYRNRNREDSTVQVSLNKVPPFMDSIRFSPDHFKLIYD